MYKRTILFLTFICVAISITAFVYSDQGNVLADKTVGIAKGSSQPSHPNIVFVMADQFRRQAMGFMHQDPAITPQFDKFSRESAYFTRAFATRPICAPNRASLFTGQYPIHHGVFGNSVRMSPQTPTLGDVAQSADYETAYIGKWHLDGPDEGYVAPERRHGFDHWIMSNHHNPFHQGYYIEDAKEKVYNDRWAPNWITNRAIDYLDQQQQKNKPFLMVVSYGPPHTGGGPGFEDRWQPGKRKNGEIKKGYGYAAPKQYEDLYSDPQNMARRPNVEPVPVREKREKGDSSWQTLPGYFGAVTSIDYNFGRLVDELKRRGIYDNTIIVFTSDHGEMLGSQGHMTKGIWYEESVGIPMMISWGDNLKTGAYNNLFNSIDIMPTILGLSGMDIPKPVDGTNFAPLLKGNERITPDNVYLSFDQGGPTGGDRSWRAIRTDRYKLVLARVERFEDREPLKGGLVLYDLQKDPYEMHPIYKGMGHDKVIQHLYNVLAEHLDKNQDPFIEKQWKADKVHLYDWTDASKRSQK